METKHCHGRHLITFGLLLMFVLMKSVYCEARSDSSYDFLFSFLPPPHSQGWRGNIKEKEEKGALTVS